MSQPSGPRGGGGDAAPAANAPRPRRLLRAGLGCLAGLLLLVALLVANALRPRAGLPPAPPAPAVVLDVPAAAERLAQALRFPTISQADGRAASPEVLADFQAFLAAAFPRTHATLAREEVAGGSLLYTWPGRRRDLPPALLLAHQDVVPVEDARGWTHPPFAGTIAGGYVWGRGAIDDKQGVLGTLEAVEALLAQGFTPARTVLLAFGHDEELGGGGARAIAQLLARRGVRPAFVLDEGGFYSRGLVPGLAAPAALVGIAEKGYLSLELEVRQEAGHSSRPLPESAIGILADAVAALEENPFPPRLDGASRASFEAFAPHLPFGQRVAIGNLWLLAPLVARLLAADPTSAAMVRTTTALTVFRAGEKDNVLPERARAVVNFRILPGDTTATVVERARRVIDDPRVAVRRLALPGAAGAGTLAMEPSRPSRSDSAAYRLIADAIRQSWDGPALVVAPILFTGATDARHFEGVAADVYRFTGVTIAPEDVARFHGVDERIAVEDYRRVVEVTSRVIQGLERLPPADGPAGGGR